MERELFFDLVPSKTSVDSGVDTGNDSNDSHTTFDSQSGRYIPGEYFRTFEIPIPNSSVKNPNTNTTREEANGSVEVGEHGKIESLQFHQPVHKASLKVDLPAGLAFCNVQPSSLGIGNGYGDKDCVIHDEVQRKIRLRRMLRHNRWSELKKSIDKHILHQAVSTNNVDRVAALLSSGVNPNSVDHQHRSPLHLAACRGYCDVVRLLLDRGANPNIKDYLGNTPLHLAACTSNVAVVTLLLKAGTDVSSIDRFGRSPLQLAKSKLRLLQMNFPSTENSNLKEEVQQVIEMMYTYLYKRGQETEAELLDAFSSRLTLSHTREEVQTGMRDLLASLASLSLDKTTSDHKKCTDN